MPSLYLYCFNCLSLMYTETMNLWICYWTVNLLQDLSDLYCIFWTHSSHGNYSPLTSAVRCWSGPWAICSGKVIWDNIASPLKSHWNLLLTTYYSVIFPFEENKTWKLWQTLAVYIKGISDQWSQIGKIANSKCQ